MKNVIRLGLGLAGLLIVLVIANAVAAETMTPTAPAPNVMGSLDEDRVVDVLQMLAASEQSYQAKQSDMTYGWLSDLQKSKDVSSDKKMDTLVRNYNVYWMLNKDMSGFAIIAVPMDKDNKYRSFMIDNTMTITRLEPMTGSVYADLQTAIDMEKSSMTKSGKYEWMDETPTKVQPDTYDLYMTQDASQCFVLTYSVSTEVQMAQTHIPQAYLSSTGKIYNWVAIGRSKISPDNEY